MRGIGSTGGFKMIVEDQGGHSPQALEAATNDLVQAANQDPALTGVFTPYNTKTPRIYADIDRAKAEILGVNDSSIFSTLQTYLGSTFVNDFNLFGRTIQVLAQADAPFRADESRLLAELRTRSTSGAMVPLGSVVNIRRTTGPYRVLRYNLFPGAEIQGDSAKGYSSGQAMAVMERLARERLPAGFGYEWTELSYQQKLAGNTGVLVFGLAVVFVFLLLAALYESVTLPFAVILIVPMCLLAAMLGINLRGMDNNILTQIGLVVLIGLAAKNAILIVEFARQGEQEHGLERHEAAAEAARTRLRPILMTSFAFILGVAPLAFAAGAGAEMRQALGVAVFFGMIGVTAFGLIFTPVFYVVFRAIAQRLPKPPPKPPAVPTTSGAPHEGEGPDGHGDGARRASLGLIGVLALAGCGVGPHYVAPQTPPTMAAQPFVSATPAVAAAAKPPADWWRLYQDPVLDRLVQQALTENKDLKVAAANLAYAQALVSEARAGLLPTTDLSGGATYGKSATADLAAALARQKPATPSWTYSAGFTAAYQVDLFGRIRRTIEAARANTEAQADAEDAVRVTVAAETTNAYVNACAYAEQVEVARQSVQVAQQTYDITARERGLGAASDFDLARAATALEQAKAVVPTIEGQRRTAVFELAALLGKTPAEAPVDAAACSTPPRINQPLPVGDGAALIRRRPDVRQAERTLAADTARIGVAAADLYPTVSLGAISSGRRQHNFGGLGVGRAPSPMRLGRC